MFDNYEYFNKLFDIYLSGLLTLFAITIATILVCFIADAIMALRFSKAYYTKIAQTDGAEEVVEAPTPLHQSYQ